MDISSDSASTTATSLSSHLDRSAEPPARAISHPLGLDAPNCVSIPPLFPVVPFAPASPIPFRKLLTACCLLNPVPLPGTPSVCNSARIVFIPKCLFPSTTKISFNLPSPSSCRLHLSAREWTAHIVPRQRRVVGLLRRTGVDSSQPTAIQFIYSHNGCCRACSPF